MVLIKLESVNREKLRQNANNLTKTLKRKRARGVEIMGPIVAPMPILVGRHRMQIILRSADLKTFRGWLQQVRPILRNASKESVRVSLDVDPKHLM